MKIKTKMIANKALIIISLILIFSCANKEEPIFSKEEQSSENKLELKVNDTLSIVLFHQKDGDISSFILKRDGIDHIIGFHNDGVTLALTGIEKKGKREGIYYTYYSNGLLNMKENYKNGKKDGIQESYSESGELVYQSIFEMGQEKEILFADSTEKDLEFVED